MMENRHPAGIDEGAGRSAGRPAARRPTAKAAARAPVYGVRTAAQVMNRCPPVVDQNTSVWGAWGRLHGPDNRHLVVVDRRLHPLGVLEARDLALRWPPGPFDAHRLPIRQLLDSSVRPQARREDAVATVARVMLTARVDAVPIVDDDGRLVGLITARDCVELVAFHAVVTPGPAQDGRQATR
jgi:CBS domain-containing protein